MTLSKLHDKNLDESDLLTVSLISPTQSFYPSSLQILFSVRHRGLGRNHTQRSYKTSVLALLGVRCFLASSYNRVIRGKGSTLTTPALEAIFLFPFVIS